VGYYERRTKMTISELRRELEKLEKKGHGNTEIRTQVDVGDHYMESGTSEIEYITEWVVVETPDDFEGMIYYDNDDAQKDINEEYNNVPLNERDDEELKTRTFFLIEIAY
jgi:fumarate hydratase class II